MIEILDKPYWICNDTKYPIDDYDNWPATLKTEFRKGHCVQYTEFYNHYKKALRWAE